MGSFRVQVPVLVVEPAGLHTQMGEDVCLLMVVVWKHFMFLLIVV